MTEDHADLERAGTELACAPQAATDLAASNVEPFSDLVIINHGRERRLELTLARGDITQIDASCYVVGLFKAVAPTGAVLALDRAMAGGISDLISRRMFSAEAGEVSVLPNGRRTLRASNVAFVGLGSFDAFTADTMKLACDNLVRTFIAAGLDDFAMVPFGWSSVSNGSTADCKTDLVRAMLAGFLRAIRDTDGDRRFRSLTICERDPDRFAMINNAVHDLALRQSFQDLELTLRVISLPEPPAQPDGLARDSAVQRIYLMAREVPQQANGDGGPGPLQIALLTSGDKAAIMVEQQPGTAAAVEELLCQLQTYPALPENAALEFGSSLAEALLPTDISRALKQYPDGHLVVVHDSAASRIPWETLPLGSQYPALRGGISHRYETANLSVAKWLQCRQQTRALSVLLVTNPSRNLPGAEAEGDRIVRLLSGKERIELTELRGNAATKDALMSAFSSARYDMVHYAGHGFFDPQQRGRSGLFCAQGEVLSGIDLAAIDNLPTLMFFNACETARVRGADSAIAAAKDASHAVQGGIGFAEALLRGGIANFIGTYWPVQDITAGAFSECFYECLINGLTLNDALLASRRALQKLADSPAPQDWADYIFYGDPDFRLKTCVDSAVSTGEPM